MGWRPAFRVSPLLLIPLLACNNDEDPLAPSLMLVNPPASLAATAIAFNLIGLTWQDNANNETGFEVHRSSGGPSGAFALLATTGAGAVSYSDYAVSSSTQYCYKARTFRTTGRKNNYSAFSNVACATTPAPPLPAAPSSANAVPAYSLAVTLTWIDNSSDENGFRIEFSLDPDGPWQLIGSTGANTTSLTQWGRTPEQTVCYRVSAFNNFGSSPPSDVDCTAPPLWPYPVTARGVAGPAIDLAWTDRSGVEDGYEVRRAGPDWQWSTVAVLPAGAQGYHDASIAADIRYTYNVAARKDGGYSDFTSASAMGASAPPSAPTSVDAVPQSSSSIAVNWAGQSANVDEFRIERSSNEGTSWDSVGTAGWDQSGFAEYGLASDVRLCYRVIALNSAGESAPSSVDCATPPARPTGLSANPVSGEAAIDVTWVPNVGAVAGYEVWLVYTDCGYYYYYCYTYYVTVAVLDANTTTYRHSGLDPSTFYTYVVVARKDGGYSDVSDQAGSYPGPDVP